MCLYIINIKRKSKVDHYGNEVDHYGNTQITYMDQKNNKYTHWVYS